ncbi:unnamed protein product [Thelazia callipaeda]|uniref:HTH_48 domain-containing protein n=1 Tax=Thelazia callipaeda TaxID=103827 RepID=A0A0N5DA54_THECL|nr:unnamed protein product [Thelazia callipaeda]
MKDIGKHSASLPESGTVRMITLEVLIQGIEVSQSRWSEEVLKAILDHFGRTTRRSWSLCRSLYSEKFLCAVILEELKQANSVTTSIAGHTCS